MASLDCGGTMLKKKIAEFVFKNWKAILIVLLLLVVVLKTRYDYHLMQSAYQTQIESSQAQIEGLKEIHKKEIEEKQLLMEIRKHFYLTLLPQLMVTLFGIL